VSYPGFRPSTTLPTPLEIGIAVKDCALLRGLSAEAVQDFLARLSWFYVPGQTMVIQKGQPCTHLMFVLCGRLRIWGADQPETGQRAVIDEVVPGEVVGDVELQGKGRHRADVEAMRDTEVGMLSIESFHAFAQQYPMVWKNVAVSVMRYIPGATDLNFAPRNENFVVIPAGSDVPIAQFNQQLCGAIAKADPVTWLQLGDVDGRCGAGVLKDNLEEWDETDRAFAGWLGEQERHHRFVFLEAGLGSTPWAARTVRSSDRILIVAKSKGNPEPSADERTIFEGRTPRKGSVVLVLLEDDDVQEPSGTREWLAWRPDVANVYHVKMSDPGHVARLARLLTGRGIGLVLGGGGARGNAHIGVIRALQELGVPVDLTGGTSAGGGISGMLAAGRSVERITHDCEHAFVTLAPFSAYDLPYAGLIQRDAVDRPARWLFDETDIEDLWLPWFAVSCDLVAGALVVHRRGRAWKAVRATSSLPGVLPPIHIRGKVLVDGGVVDNTPVSIMRQLNRGPCILVNVSPPEEKLVGDDVLDLPTNRDYYLSSMHPMLASRTMPSIGSVVVQTMCVSGLGSDAAQKADLFIEPEIARYGIVEFEAMNELIALGYNATMAAFEKRANDTEFLKRFGLTTLKTPLPRMEVPVWEGQERRRKAALRAKIRNTILLTAAGAVAGALLPSLIFHVPVVEGAIVGALLGLAPTLLSMLDAPARKEVAQ
jgi:predicted acylesterase/phospholipase RssA